MSVNHSLSVDPRLPAGTVLSVHRGSWPTVDPGGAAVTTATVQPDGTATVVGVDYDTRYTAGATISSVWRAVVFRTAPDPGLEYATVAALESAESRGALPASPWDEVYLGNATPSEYTSEPNIPIQVKTYHGTGYYPVTGRPQGIQIISKYRAPTATDSAQAGSSGVFLVDVGTPFEQTLPLTGMEGDAVTQGENTLSNKAVGVAGSAEAQDTSHIDTAICFYAAEKSASDAGASIDFWAGLYVENPLAVGTVTDSAGVYSKPRIQTEEGIIVGVTQASVTSNMKGMTMYVQGTNDSGQPSVKIVKKSGSTDNILEVADSGAIAQVLVDQGGRLVVKTSGASHSLGSGVGAMIALGNITTPPSANFTGGTGGFLYVESGALKFRGGGGLVTTIAASS
jgi:hypothetical protein